jgi:hypothetical protein
MSTPSFPMTQPVGSPGGLKSQQEYDSAWKNLTDLNQRMYGGQQPSGGSNPSSLYKAPSKGGDFSAYAPGKAQPTQTPSLGTPYGQQDWYSPKPISQSFGAPQDPVVSLQRQQSQLGDYGNNPDARPQGFAAQYFDYSGNPVSFEQQQAQRAAMVQQLRQAELPFVFGNALNQNMGPQTLDVPTLLTNANTMVDNGFYNPFLQRLQPDPMQQPAPAQFNPYMPSDTGWWGMGPKPTAPPMQADPYQEWLSSLPGYQSRDQWMTKQPTPRYGEPSYRVLSPFAARGRRGY